MNTEALNEAVKQAKEFLNRVATYKKAMADGEKEQRQYCKEQGFQHVSIPQCPKESASVKRASMDLTRALVGVRRP